MKEETRKLILAWSSGGLFMAGIILIYGFLNGEMQGMRYIVSGIFFLIFSIFAYFKAFK